MWMKVYPKKEGWYLWRKTRKQNDPIKWHAYFVDEDGTCWENGTNVFAPTGGWWSSVPCGMPSR